MFRNRSTFSLLQYILYRHLFIILFIPFVTLFQSVDVNSLSTLGRKKFQKKIFLRTDKKSNEMEMDDSNGEFVADTFITPTPSPTPYVINDPYIKGVRETQNVSPYQDYLNQTSKKHNDQTRKEYILNEVNELKAISGYDEKIIIYSLYGFSGDYEMTKTFLMDNKGLPWTFEEDVWFNLHSSNNTTNRTLENTRI